MLNKQVIEAWDEFLIDRVGCKPDEHGNRPCDNGAPCDKCLDQTVLEDFRKVIGIA